MLAHPGQKADYAPALDIELTSNYDAVKEFQRWRISSFSVELYKFK